ncbi:MAG: hypothetical protein GY928_20715 [Colwellia sp.]|nr:hypothetical protein [Colwellia sp.]
MSKGINLMTKKEIINVPSRKSWSTKIVCNSLVIIPLRRIHDSGYRCIDLIAVKSGKPICSLSGISDVIDLGGFFNKTDDGWRIECLKTSGLLNIFNINFRLVAGPALSDLTITTSNEND